LTYNRNLRSNVAMHQDTPQQPHERLLTVNEVADLLSCTPNAVRNMVQRRQLPFVRLSPRKLRFKPQAIETYIEERQVQAAG
jgi:excisionase family DNA binding protein